MEGRREPALFPFARNSATSNSVHLAGGDRPLLAKLPIEERLTPGQEQEFSIPREKLHVFDAQTELAVSA